MNHFTTTMLACGIMLAALPAARAADTICTLSSPIPRGTTVNGNLTVPSGPGCTLAGVTVTGNVQVQTNAALTIDFPPPSTIDGNLSVGTGASMLVVGGGLTIDGNFAANQCNVALLTAVTVGGNVQIQYCTGIVSLGASDIGGNVAINDNSTATVNNNAIGNNLGCQGNASITDGGNSVDGHKSGQCANF